MAKQFITTPIYYVNDSPHIGHAYTTLAADVLTRHYKAKGDDAYLLTGTDEHGSKIFRTAMQKSIIKNPMPTGRQENDNSKFKNVQNFTDKISQEFKDAWKLLDIRYDQFIRTTDPAHKKIVSEFLIKVKNAGYIYEGKYEGPYCVGCEEYKKRDELINGMCIIHKKKAEKITEKNWYFRLSTFQDKIIELLESKRIKVFPDERYNELLSFVKGGLDDIAISRSNVEWGIPLPWDGHQTIYVWVDALINYYSAPIMADKDIFPPDVQFIGKDILRFHGVIFPALLLSIGLEPSHQLVSHGFFTINGHKMSKSLGNTITPKELIDMFGVDGTRYLLLSQFPFGLDGDFSMEKLETSYNARLANDLGNLVQRVLILINKSNIAITPNTNPFRCASADIYIEQFQLDRALEEIFRMVGNANIQIDKEKPWEKANQISNIKNPMPTGRQENDKENIKKELEKTLTSLFRQLETIAASLAPFMPDTSQNIFNQLKTLNPTLLFPRVVK